MQDSDKTTNATPPRIQINKENNMSIIKYEPVHIGDFSSFIENLVSKTKSKRFRAGFMKKADDFKKSGKYVYRTGKFDFKYRKTWKQTDGTMYKRKGKARTTKSEDYLLAHDLVKKAPRNISYQRLLWISVGKKIWGVSQFRLADEHIRLYVLNPTKYSQLKNLLRGNLDGSTMQ